MMWPCWIKKNLIVTREVKRNITLGLLGYLDIFRRNILCKLQWAFKVCYKSKHMVPQRGAAPWLRSSGQHWNWLKTGEMFPFCSFLKCLNHFLLEWNKVLSCFISRFPLTFFPKLKCFTQTLLKTSLKGLSTFLFTPNTFFSRHNYHGAGSSWWLRSSSSCVGC